MFLDRDPSPPSAEALAEPGEYLAALAAGLIAGAVVAGVVDWITTELLPWPPRRSALLTAMQMISQGSDSDAWSWAHVWPWWWRGTELARWLVVGLGGYWIGLRTLIALWPRPAAARLVRGHRLVDAGGLANWLAHQPGDPGIQIAPGCRLRGDLDRRSTLFVGEPGAGKTVGINYLLAQRLARGDYLVALDLSKGDFCSWIPASAAGVEPLLLSVSDARTAVWETGADIDSPALAHELAAGLIPGGSGDQFWTDGGRQILVAGILHLTSTRGPEWGLSEIGGLASLTLDEWIEITKAYGPARGVLGEDPGSRTAQSLISTLTAAVAPLSLLPRLQSGRSTWSVREWLTGIDAGDTRIPQTIIIQGDAQRPAASHSLARAALSVLAGIIVSPSFPESQTRRVAVIADELPQIGKLDALPKLAEIGRSKGITLTIGIQSLAQIREVYSRDAADSILGTIGIKIVGRSTDPDTADVIRRIGGIQEWQVPTVTTSDSGSISRGWSPLRRDTITPELLASLGPDRRGVRLLVLGLNDPALIHIPFPHLEEQRPGYVPQDQEDDAGPEAELTQEHQEHEPEEHEEIEESEPEPELAPDPIPPHDPDPDPEPEPEPEPDQEHDPADPSEIAADVTGTDPTDLLDQALTGGVAEAAQHTADLIDLIQGVRDELAGDTTRELPQQPDQDPTPPARKRRRIIRKRKQPRER